MVPAPPAVPGSYLSQADEVVYPENVAPVPVYLLEQVPIPVNLGYAPEPDARFEGTERTQPSLADVVRLPMTLPGGSYTGSSRNAHSML